MKVVEINGELAWAVVAYHILYNVSIASTGGIKYSARIMDDTIYFSGGKRAKEEAISKADFVSTFNAIKHLNEINTSTIKKFMAKDIYAKRSPFIGLLITTGLIQ